MCLNQCKTPAQDYFSSDLGLPLTVSPNFVTGECQWSWGETPQSTEEMAKTGEWPRGCLSGCASRKQVNFDDL